MLAPSLLLAQTVEDCTNGMDDDGDGLIDCFDPDCTCGPMCQDFFYTNCNADCYFIPPCDSISLGVQWVSEAETGTYPVLVAGDMDGDGVPEVVTYKNEAPDLYIIDGATGATKAHFVAPVSFSGGTAPAIADLDNDGYGELVIVGDDRLLRCFEHTGVQKFVSTVQAGYVWGAKFSVPNIADMDGNGQPEVIIGNQVFSGQTGVLLAEGGPALSKGEHPARAMNGYSFAQTVCIDALPDSFCPDCDGLEIVAGNQVLAVNLVAGTVTMATQAAAPFTDGFTSVADFDRDGDLDGVIQGRKGALNYVYVWELESPTVMREFKLYTNWVEGASRPNIADLDGDGQLDIAFVGFPWLYALGNDFSVLWTLPTSDASSITGTSMFDFCGDGTVDLIYRAYTHLQVLDGATGSVEWQDDCTSITHLEYPLVLDVDADGQTEILITCGQASSSDFGNVVAFEAVGTPGISSRKVWNQHGYFNTNINEDLSVPVHQQNPHIVGDGLQLNTFLNQYFNPNFPAGDASVSMQSVVCDRDSLELSFTICNTGDNFMPINTPFSLYKGNPTSMAAQLLGTFPINYEVMRDSCHDFVIRMPRVANDSIFFVFNDNHSIAPPFDLEDDFPSTSIGECFFSNNMVGFYYAYNPSVLDIGSDTLICDNATVALNAAGTDFTNWTWSTGDVAPAITALDAGIFAVTITDVCGNTQTDVVAIAIDSSTVVTLGPDQSMCKGETIAMGESGFDYYLWKPAAFVNCPSCASVNAAPSQSTNFILEAGFNNGCRSWDSLFVTVYDTFNYKIDTTICYGRTVIWNGVEILPDEDHWFAYQTTHGCDSMFQVRVHGTLTGTYQFHIDTAVCEGQYFNYSGISLPPDSSYTFYLSALTGCDSTVSYATLRRDTFYTTEEVIICPGETAVIFGQSYSQSGVHAMKFPAINGCDSTHRVNLTVLNEMFLDVGGTPTCLNESTGTLFLGVSGGVPPWMFSWNIPNETGPIVEELPAGNYSVTVTDSNGCTKEIDGEVPGYPPILYTVDADSVRCYGEENGAIAIQAADSTLVFSLDGAAYGQKTEFKMLKAGNYTVYAQDVHGCVEPTAVEVAQPNELLVALPPDTTLQLGDSLVLDIQTNSFDTLHYQWQTPLYLSCLDCATPVITPWNTVRYQLQVTDQNGCVAQDEMLVTVQRLIQVYMPNVFNPNAQNDYNRRYQASFGQAVSRIKSFSIFDRWGTLVHHVEDKAPGDPAIIWDGNHHGKAVLPGVYVWFLEIEVVDGGTEMFKGDLTVLR